MYTMVHTVNAILAFTLYILPFEHNLLTMGMSIFLMRTYKVLVLNSD